MNPERLTEIERARADDYALICSLRTALDEATTRADAWAAAFETLANSVLEGVYFAYDAKDDTGGSSFLCTCSHDTDGFPHDVDCGGFLVSTLPEDDRERVAREDREAEVRLRGEKHIAELERQADR